MIGSAVWEACLAREVTILRADLRSVSGVTLEGLNRCFSAMSEIIFRHAGRIDKFAADSLLVLFESEEKPADGALRAVSCAVDMQAEMEALNVLLEAEAEAPIYLGIGVNTARVMSTKLGVDLYSEYSEVGDEVNLASRIESFTLRGQVLISETTYRRCDGFVKTGEPIDVFVKGRSKLVALREVVSIPSLGKVVPPQDHRRSPRAAASIPFTYRMVVNGVVVPEARPGTILDIGYHGVLVEIGLAISAGSDLQLDFELPLVDERFRALAGHAVKVIPKDATARVGIEFNAMSPQQRGALQRYVQLLVQP
ncbi:MAG TPA: adenylate/guanylate cyclase domain-containing protein [Usitatibacter sp.]|jgi:adenylate cyclase|nr:adenylate/guanylate cyclase domain-containing protein [Usitatibacter sp.]